jgi:acyl-CoA synthetase (AMP-forming)/AMP-acid ligase II
VWDEEGYIMVLGRSDDVLNVAGHRIGTADVESALITHARWPSRCDRHPRRNQGRGDQGICGAAPA